MLLLLRLPSRKLLKWSKYSSKGRHWLGRYHLHEAAASHRRESDNSWLHFDKPLIQHTQPQQHFPMGPPLSNCAQLGSTHGRECVGALPTAWQAEKKLRRVLNCACWTLCRGRMGKDGLAWSSCMTEFQACCSEHHHHADLK